jgi:hypothetical protein
MNNRRSFIWMKQLALIFGVGCLFILVLASCQEPYSMNDLVGGKKIPVIQGSITNESGPYEVNLLWASSFGSDKAADPIEDATVYIFDDMGNQEPLAMSTSGYYKTTTDDYKGICGRTYTLHVELPNGDIYESTPTKLDTVPMTYSLYGEVGTLEDYTTDSYGNISTEIYKGVHYYVDMASNTTQQQYYYFSIRMITQTIIADPPEYVPVYWQTISYLNTIPNIKATIENNNEQIVKEHELGFLRYIRKGISRIPKGWILLIRIYSVSSEIYNYYQSIMKQLNSDTQIFDPIPSQINGNMKCLSDTTQIVLGVFEVAAKYSKNIGVFWKSGMEDIEQIELPIDYEGPSFDVSGSEPFDSWINF